MEHKEFYENLTKVNGLMNELKHALSVRYYELDEVVYLYFKAYLMGHYFDCQLYMDEYENLTNKRGFQEMLNYKVIL